MICAVFEVRRGLLGCVGVVWVRHSQLPDLPDFEQFICVRDEFPFFSQKCTGCGRIEIYVPLREL